MSVTGASFWLLALASGGECPNLLFHSAWLRECCSILIVPLTRWNDDGTVSTRRRGSLVDGNVPCLQSRCSHPLFSKLGWLEMASLPSLQGKTGNEIAALCCTRSSHGTPVCARPAGPRLRGHCVHIYVRNHLPSATGKRPS